MRKQIGRLFQHSCCAAVKIFLFFTLEIAESGSYGSAQREETPGFIIIIDRIEWSSQYLMSTAESAILEKEDGKNRPWNYN